MAATLDELKITLKEYLEAVPKQKEANPPDLLAIFARLDNLQKRLDASAPAQLRHYMIQKSYRKAWNFLEGNEAENMRGQCG